jgi:two-component system LytT family response regulator
VIKSIIIDDEIANIKNLNVLLNKYCPEITIVNTSDNIYDAEKIIRADKPDLIFLDIRLKEKTAFDLLPNIQDILFEVIFVTAYDEYGIQAIKFAALDYIFKPINIKELQTAVAKAVLKIKSNQQNSQIQFLIDQLQPAQPSRKIALPMQSEIRYVNIDEIIRCKADNTYTTFHLTNETIIISKSLKEYTDLLTPYGFIRTHQSHLINTKYIKSWLKEDGGTILLENGKKIPVSRQKRDLVKNILFK